MAIPLQAERPDSMEAHQWILELEALLAPLYPFAYAFLASVARFFITPGVSPQATLDIVRT